MPPLVVNGATCTCTFGTGPSTLTIPPARRANGVSQPGATIMDNIPMANVQPFIMCVTPTNPQVAAATSAALGVLTPQPCIPVTTSPWTPGASQTMIGGQPALHAGCTLMCAWGGVISITSPGQTTVQVT